MKTISFSYYLLFCVFGLTAGVHAQSNSVSVHHFEKVIISPHIEVTLVEGDEESVRIDDAKLSEDKIKIKVEGKTLRIYLDGAKTFTKSERVTHGEWNGRRSRYHGTLVSATITYKTLKMLSVRGEEVVSCKSAINQAGFKLRIYGESKVYLDSVSVDEFIVSLYGESYLKISEGSINRQVYRAYGESEVNAMAIGNASTKITAYGESNFRVNVSDRLKVSCYGEASIDYRGEAAVNKGIVIGEASIRKIG